MIYFTGIHVDSVKCIIDNKSYLNYFMKSNTDGCISMKVVKYYIKERAQNILDWLTSKEKAPRAEDVAQNSLFQALLMQCEVSVWKSVDFFQPKDIN